MADFRKTSVEYLNVDEYATFYSGENRWINKIIKLAQERPDEVQIIDYPENNFGHITAHIPKSWLKISPPKEMNLTEEQRLAAAERMRIARESKQQGE